MRKQNMQAAICGLAAVLLLGCASMSPTYGHYENTAAYQGTISMPTPMVVTGDLLRAGGQQVRIGQLDYQESIPLNFYCPTAPVRSTLTCEGSEHISAVLEREQLDMWSEGTHGVYLTLTPSLEDLTEPISESVTVRWEPDDGQQMEATIQADLIPPDYEPPEDPPLEEPEEMPPLITDCTSTFGSTYPLVLEFALPAESKGKLLWDMGEFPEKTRYFLDGSWNLVYNESEILVSASGKILLDFSLTDVWYLDGNHTLSVQWGDVREDKIVTYTPRDLTLPESTFVFSQQELTIPICTRVGQLEWSVQKMELTDGKIHWKKLTNKANKWSLPEGGVTVNQSEDSMKLVMAETPLPMGTYQIQFKWLHNGAELYSAEALMFVCNDYATEDGGILQ